MTIGRGLRAGLAPLAATLAVALFAAGAPSPAAAATPANANIAGAVAGAAPLRDSAATDIGPYSASHLPITLVLAWRDSSGLSSLLAAPHAPLTPSAFESRFSPSVATVAAVRSWATGNGLAVTSVSANRALVTVAGSSNQVAHALGTQFDRFHSSRDGDFFAATGPAQLPAALAPEVRAILGLSSLPHVSLQPPAHRSASALTAGLGAIADARSAAGAALPSSIDYPTQYTPQQLWSIYD
ncbi:MAG: protease pro-enzyme activation domain-containing protein, partial [Solirubrobacteraceae bacterium]